MEAVLDVKRVSNRIMLIKLVAGKNIVTVLLVYAPQAGLDSVKDLLYGNLQWILTKIHVSEIVFICRDFNGHIVKNSDGYEGVRGRGEFGRCNLKGENILKFTVTHNLVVSNSVFMKRQSHQVTYQPGENKSQIYYNLVKQQNIKLVRNVQVIPTEVCVTQ